MTEYRIKEDGDTMMDEVIYKENHDYVLNNKMKVAKREIKKNLLIMLKNDQIDAFKFMSVCESLDIKYVVNVEDKINYSFSPLFKKEKEDRKPEDRKPEDWILPELPTCVGNIKPVTCEVKIPQD